MIRDINQYIKQGIIAIGILLFTFSGVAQIKKANKYFDAMHYAKAISLYQKVLEKETDSIAVKNIAESYRRINDTKNAEIYYRQAAQLYPENKQIQFNYGQLLKANSKLDEAKEVFIVYASENPLDKMSQKYVLSCDQIKSWTVEIPNFEASEIEGINTEAAEFSAVPFENGVAFVTDKFVDYVEGTQSGSEDPYLKIAYSEQKEDSSFKKGKPIKAFNNHFHNGPICFNENQTLAVFTRVEVAKKQDKDFVNKPQLLISKKEGNSWSKPEYFEHNDIDHSYVHSSLSKDESLLFFASDREGGYGGFDIYLSKKEGTGWSTPQNLGDKVNTFGNEVFPYAYTNDTLYFSSNTHVGYGGQDVFYTTFQENVWTAPMNLKNEVNSPKDDFGIVFTDKKNGFFSSNRDGGQGKDDIYSFRLIQELKERTSVSGIFLYSELDPAKGAKISLLDEDGNVMMVTEADEDGKFVFENLESDRNYFFMVDENDTNLSMQSKIYLTNEKGEKIVALNQPGPGLFKFRSLQPDQIAALPILDTEDVELSFIDIYGQLFDKLPGDFNRDLEVLLIDDDGEVLYRTMADSTGNFAFENVLQLEDYKIILQPDTTANMMYVDAEGNKVSDAERNSEGEYDYKKQEFLANSKVFGRVYKELPGDYGKQMEVFLLDDNGEIVYTALTDSLGNFIFENLPPELAYTVKINEEDGAFKLMMLDEKEGEDYVAELNDKGDYVLKKRVENVNNFFGRVYKELPGDYGKQMEVYLVDDDGNIVYTALTDENGDFVFENLPLDQQFILKLKEEDGTFKLINLDESGEPLASAQKDANGDYILQQRLDDVNDFFGKVYQKLPGDYSKGLEVYLVDDDGNIVLTTTTDENGDFVFENLPADHNYALKFQETNDDLNLVVLDEYGQVKSKPAKSADGEYAVEQRPDDSNLFGTIYQKLPGDYTQSMEVYLVDDDGNIVLTATTDENGDFVFENLPPDHNYSLKFQETDDELNLVVLDEYGEVKSKPVKSASGEYLVEDNTTDNSLFGNIYQKLPGDYSQGMDVYLVDDDGNVVYTATTDENGDFVFENLPADHNYRIRLKDDQDMVNMMVLNDFGSMEQLKADGAGEFDVTEAPKRNVYGNFYKTLPGDLNEELNVKLLNNEGVVVFASKTDKSGNFEFKNLPIDASYQLKLDFSNDYVSMIVTNEAGEMIASGKNIGGGVYEVNEETPSMYGRVFNKLPGDFGQQMEVYLVDDEGNVVYTATTDANGEFVFENLPADHNYHLKFKEDVGDINLVILDEYGNEMSTPEKESNGTYSYTQEDETASIFGKAYNKLPGDFGQQMEVYLVDDDGNIMYTTTTDENGDFEFKNLPSDKSYILRFEASDTDMQLLLLDEQGNELEDISQAENGDFSYEYLNADKEFIALLTLDDAIIKIREDEKFTMVNLYFNYDSYEITLPTKREIDKLALVLNKNPHVGLQIKGFTDDKGAETYNLKLSGRRANAVANYIVSKGIDKNRLSAKGFGEVKPIAPNELPNGEDNPEGRKKNRRTEINIIKLK